MNYISLLAPPDFKLSDLTLSYIPSVDSAPIVMHLDGGLVTVVGYIGHDAPGGNSPKSGVVYTSVCDIGCMLGMDRSGRIISDTILDAAVRELRFQVSAMDLIISELEIDSRIRGLDDNGNRLMAMAKDRWRKDRDPMLVYLENKPTTTGESYELIPITWERTMEDYWTFNLPFALWNPYPSAREYIYHLSNSAAIATADLLGISIDTERRREFAYATASIMARQQIVDGEQRMKKGDSMAVVEVFYHGKRTYLHQSRILSSDDTPADTLRWMMDEMLETIKPTIGSQPHERP